MFDMLILHYAMRLLPVVPELATHRTGSHVVKAALMWCDERGQRAVAAALLRAPLAEIARDRFGRHVAEELTGAPGLGEEARAALAQSLPKPSSCEAGQMIRFGEVTFKCPYESCMKSCLALLACANPTHCIRPASVSSAAADWRRSRPPGRPRSADGAASPPCVGPEERHGGPAATHSRGTPGPSRATQSHTGPRWRVEEGWRVQGGAGRHPSTPPYQQGGASAHACAARCPRLPS